MCEKELIWAIKTGQLDDVKGELEKQTDFDFDKCLCNGRPPLHIAADFGHLDVVKFFISEGAGVNVVDKHGQTPLMTAVLENHIDCVKLLLDKDADKCVFTPDGKTLAESTDNPDIKALLQ